MIHQPCCGSAGLLLRFEGLFPSLGGSYSQKGRLKISECSFLVYEGKKMTVNTQMNKMF